MGQPSYPTVPVDDSFPTLKRVLNLQFAEVFDFLVSRSVDKKRIRHILCSQLLLGVLGVPRGTEFVDV